MSDLQISLLAIGAVVVAGVYLFNLHQERQLRRRTEQAFAKDHPDVLLDAASEAPRVEPSLAPAAAEPVAPVVPVVAATEDTTPVDPVIDYVVEVQLSSPASPAPLRDTLRAQFAEIGKPVLAEGYDAARGDWADAGTTEFGRLRFAMQMSNRAGCVSAAQLTTFRDAVAGWAEARGGEAKALEVDAAHAMAAQLDRFCADVDIAIGLNIVSADGNPFTGARIRALAEQHGLKLEADGVFYARAGDGAVLYTLDNHEPMPFMPEQIRTLHTRGITFLLDVPRVATALEALDAMLTAARAFAGELGGTLVDDNRARLTDSAIDGIRRQLEGVLAKMEAGRIPAGGARALRLFA